MKQALLQNLHDAQIQDWCGNVLYSSIDTLKKGDIYFLGTNPGGDPAKEIMTWPNTLNSLHPIGTSIWTRYGLLEAIRNHLDKHHSSEKCAGSLSN